MEVQAAFHEAGRNQSTLLPVTRARDLPNCRAHTIACWQVAFETMDGHAGFDEKFQVFCKGPLSHPKQTFHKTLSYSAVPVIQAAG